MAYLRASFFKKLALPSAKRYRIDLNERIAEIRARARTMIQRPHTALFYEEDALQQGQPNYVFSPFPHELRIAATEMDALLHKLYPYERYKGQLCVLQNFEELEQKLFSLKGSDQPSFLLLNHHNRIHWDGLIVHKKQFIFPVS